MLSVLLVVGLALVLAAVSSLVRGGSRPLTANSGDTAEASVPLAAPNATNLLVLVAGPSAEEVTQAAVEFRRLYESEKVVAYPFQAHAIEPDVTALTFPHDLPTELFYYLINYLSYPKAGYAASAHVRGWATLPIMTRERLVSPPESVMVCVPPDDTEYDVVLLLTPAPAVYQVSFQNLLPILLRYPVPVAYMAPPYSLEAIRQLPATILS
ncbi:hypothetical protein [Hymenobacter wooponensis]|uniref:Uncharacterized protein n=1 Tax=Hymenobacter wooponensis TaxID=1525360 RepID=A0A4Z0MT85_9BACT|nr:hypothetical protein [Hymenobacter wooponensis]TGD82457.1 hypothetical protein EU557_01335 [Hymenobacter wooponensis]